MNISGSSGGGSNCIRDQGRCGRKLAECSICLGTMKFAAGCIPYSKSMV